MNEARRVLDRLSRIDVLRAEGASPPELLAELQALVAEGEAWVRAESAGTRKARDALVELAHAVGRASAPSGSAEAIVGAGEEVVSGQ